MNDLEHYLCQNYRMEILRDVEEGGYIISYPELKGCITCTDEWNDIQKTAEDAKRTWIRAALEMGYPIPEPISDGNYSGQFKLRIPKSLHRELSEGAKKEGISMNQYCLYILSRERFIS